MPEELKQAAQAALEALDEIHAGKRHPQLALAVANNLRRALTQRPAAQAGEREAFEAWWPTVGQTIGKVAAWEAWQFRASLPAPQQATPAEEFKTINCTVNGINYTGEVRRVDENTVDIGRVVAFADEQKATPEPEHDMAGMLARGAKAWAGVDPQELRTGGLKATPEPAGEPFGYFRALPFGWEQCGEHDDGAVALYTRPAPDGWTEADADAARLAMELECLLLDTKDTAAVSRWWKSANEALDLHRARLAAAQGAQGAAHQATKESQR